MPRGPAPKPTLLKIASGNPGRRPINTREPRPESAAGTPPEWLGDGAKKLWFRIAGPMVRCGLATAVDEHALARYCSLLHLWIRALAGVEKARATSYSIKSRKGHIVGHRELAHFSDLRRLGPQLTQLEREFGLTPSARTRIQLAREDRMDRDGDGAVDAFFLGPTVKRPGA